MHVGQARLHPKTKQALRLVLGTGISLLFLWLALRGVDWAETWATMRRADAGLLLAALVSVLLTTGIKAARWRLMFPPNPRKLRLRNFFGVFLIGQVINAVIPLRLGEVVRALLIGQKEGVSKAHALWTTVTEKVLDSLVLLVFMAGISFLVPLPGWLQQAGWTLSLGIVAGFALLGLALWRKEWTLARVDALTARYSWLGRLHLQRLFVAVVESLQLVRYPRLFWGVLGWSFGAFLMAAATNWLVGRAIGLELGYTPSLLLLSVLQISAVVPLPTSPGRVGLFHYLCVLSLAIFGVERDVALGYGLILHLVVYLPMAVGGPLGLWLENMDWRALSRTWQQEVKPDSPTS